MRMFYVSPAGVTTVAWRSPEAVRMLRSRNPTRPPDAQRRGVRPNRPRLTVLQWLVRACVIVGGAVGLVLLPLAWRGFGGPFLLKSVFPLATASIAEIALVEILFLLGYVCMYSDRSLPSRLFTSLFVAAAAPFILTLAVLGPLVFAFVLGLFFGGHLMVEFLQELFGWRIGVWAGILCICWPWLVGGSVPAAATLCGAGKKAKSRCVRALLYVSGGLTGVFAAAGVCTMILGPLMLASGGSLSHAGPTLIRTPFGNRVVISRPPPRPIEHLHQQRVRMKAVERRPALLRDSRLLLEPGPLHGAPTLFPFLNESDGR